MIRRILFCLAGVLAAVLCAACIIAAGEIAVLHTAVPLPVNELILAAAAVFAAAAVAISQNQ